MPLEYERNVLIQPLAGFHGMDLGDWENCAQEELARADQGRFQVFLSDPDYRAPGGESLREVYARAYPELVNLVHHAEEGETLALILEQNVLQVTCCALLDLGLEAARRFVLQPGRFGVFERSEPKGPYQLTAWQPTHDIFNTVPSSLDREEEMPGV